MIYIVWGSTYFFIGEAMKELPIYLLGALRFTLAGALLMGLSVWRGESILSWETMRASVPCGIAMLFLDMVAIMVAQKYITSSLEAVLAASTLFWITLFDCREWRHNFSRLGVPLGMALGLFGVALLYWGEFTAPGGEGGYGVLVFLGGMLAWSVGSLYIKYHAAGHEAMNVWSGTAWQMLGAGGAFWLVSVLSGELPMVQWSEITYACWGNVLYLVVLGSVCAYTSYVWLLKVRPATEVATHAYVNPLIGILLGACIGGEAISLTQWGGLVVILSSLFLVNSNREYKITL